MTKVGIGLPGQSVADVRGSAEAAAPYSFDSFSVYGDLGDLPPYAVLHAAADFLQGKGIKHIGPMGIPVGLQHAEVIGMHALALEEQLPDQSYVGLVRGAFLDAIGEKPATLARLEDTVTALRTQFEQHEQAIPIYIGGFGQRVLTLAGRLAVEGIKLGGSTNPKLAEKAQQTIGNPQTKIVLGAVSVIDADRKAARQLARREVAKYLDVVGSFDTTLGPDEMASLASFVERFRAEDPQACNAISDSLLDKFALAGTPEDAIEAITKMNGIVDRFEFGTPHGLHDRAGAIHNIGRSIVNELGEQDEISTF
jgi:5,10-methylenetetrahydromethanopterin reductase